LKVAIVLFENFFLYSIFFYVVLLITFYHARDISIIIAVVVLSYLCVYLSCWVAT